MLLLNSTSLLEKHLRLRRRYILTRRKTLRLRVPVMMGVSILALGVTSFSFKNDAPAYSSHIDVARIAQPKEKYAQQDEKFDGEIASLMRSVDNQKQTPSQSQEDISTQYSKRLKDSDNDEAAAAGIQKASAILRKAPQPLRETVKIGAGDTIAGLLNNSGIDNAETHKIIAALEEHIDARTIRAGQDVNLRFKPIGYTDRGFRSLKIDMSPVKEVEVTKQKDGTFSSIVTEKPLVKRTHSAQAKIQTSLYGSAARAGIPAQVVAEVIKIYSFNIDFQRDIRQGDTIEIFYETMETEDGKYVDYGDVLYANLGAGKKARPVYRFEMADGRIDYFDPEGRSVKKVLMKTPIDGARISSGFGMRHHPVLGYNKMHKGMDFAAPTGTPIYAAGDGVIEKAGRNGGYGNYIRIRHNSKLKTAYAHMHKLAKGMSSGSRVKQGEVIGYVGTTGRSTGPHLHYEVLKHGTQVNPNSIDLPVGEELAGKELKTFKALASAVYEKFMIGGDGYRIAQAQVTTPSSKPEHHLR